jgi:Ca2+-transporting ATPase
MGGKGTDISKEAADMVLADDNFATIVHAVEEGRRIYDNIRRVVRYLLTTNAGELMVMVLAPAVGLPLPLLPVQLLWINLMTDGVPAIALGLEPAPADTMHRPPRSAGAAILSPSLWRHVVWVGTLMAAVTLALQALAHTHGWPWQTMVFATLAMLQLGHALVVRSDRDSIFSLRFRTNLTLLAAVALGVLAQLAIVYVPMLQEAFETEALDAAQLGLVMVLSTTVFFAVELEKLVRRRGSRRGGRRHSRPARSGRKGSSHIRTSGPGSDRPDPRS